MKVDAILLKPLDGAAPGTPRAFEQVDFDRLKAMGAVRARGEKDEAPAPVDEDVEMIEKLRHPVEGPILLAALKERFEALERDRDRLRDEVERVEKLAGVNGIDRDTARSERDAAIAQRDAATQAADAATKELAVVREELVAVKAAGAAPARKGSREA